MATTSFLQRLESIGHWFFYIMLRFFGQKGGYLLLYPVMFCYALCSPGIHRRTAPYLQLRFPGHGFMAQRLNNLKNLLAFGKTLVDRGWLGLCPDAALQGEFSGYEHLQPIIDKGQGMILLTAHVGNWQSAFANMDQLPVKINALMQYDQTAAAKHYFDLHKKARPFTIIDAEGAFGGMVEATAALGRGEVVTIMGDRFIRGSSTTVDFMGADVRLPDSAYTLASCTKTPIVILLAAKTGQTSYTLKVWDVFYPGYKSRDERGPMIETCCLRFSKILEKYVKENPYQWYNFFDFWKQ